VVLGADLGKPSSSGSPYGYRPGGRPTIASISLGAAAIVRESLGRVLDADIEAFFDTTIIAFCKAFLDNGSGTHVSLGLLI